MRKFYFILIALLLLLHSCTQQYTENHSNLQKSVFDPYIERTSDVLDVNDASKVAALFGGTNFCMRSSSYDITEIDDSISKSPLLFVVNFGNNNGYIIISASKNTSPILAYSDKDSFSFSEDNPSAIFLSEYMQTVKMAMQCPSDSLRIKYALQWAPFEETEAQLETRSVPSVIKSKINAEIKYRESLGYRHLGSLTVANRYLPTTKYQALLKEMEMCSDPSFDYKETVQLFVKSFDYEKIGELMSTQWNQDFPFNVDAPNGLAGCVPIAVAQIAYYHKFPSKYKWEKISVSPTLNDEFSYFIKDIRNICNVDYKSDQTSASFSDAKSALMKLGYSVVEEGTPSFDNLREQIRKKKPVYIRGEKSNGKGHAWVCDGYENVKYNVLATYIPNPNDNKFKFAEKSPNGYASYNLTLYPISSLDQELFGEFFHMNLGWGGTDNGWYRSNTNMPSSKNGSYLYEQKTLFVTH